MMARMNDFRELVVMAAVVLAAGLLVLLTAEKQAEAAFPGTNGKIAFTSNYYDAPEISVMNPDGTGQTSLTNNSAYDTDPAFSADGSKIAFVSDRDGNQEIYVMDADGSHLIRLTNNAAIDSQPAFSSDGTRILFVSTRDGNKEIYTIGSDGSNPTRLTTSSANEEDPAFSSDGSKLAFTSDRDGNKEIYIMNPDGSDPVRLTSNPADDYQPNWSPDGSKIAFASDRDIMNSEIFVMNSDGSGQSGITDSTDDYSDFEPSFSPDGSKIAFASNWHCEVDLCGGILSLRITVINADGSGRIALGHDFGCCDISPDWGISRSATDTTPPDTSITSGPSGPTNDTTPTFSFDGSDNVSLKVNLLYSYKVIADGIAPESVAWSEYSSSTSATLGGTTGLEQGYYTFYVKAKDEAGNEDLSPAQQSFTLDTVPPTGTLTINDGASSTRTRSVTLTIGASDPSLGSGVTQMRISNTLSGLSSASWEAYTNKKSWMLSTGSGTKTVYVQYRDAAENISAVVQDMIAYKT